MKQEKGVYVTKRDFKVEFNREYQFYTNEVVRSRDRSPLSYDEKKSHEVGCQYDCKKDNHICTCRNLSALRKKQEVRYFKLPNQIYAFQGSRSFTDIGVGSVKALPRKKVKKIYLPEIDDRGVGSSDLSSFLLRKTKHHRNTGFYETKRTSSKCVGGILEYNTGCVMNEKLSPIVQTISGATSPQDSTFNKNIEIGSNTVVKTLTNTTTQVEELSRKEIEIKPELRTEDIIQPVIIIQTEPRRDSDRSKEKVKTLDDSRKITERKDKRINQFSSSDSLLQHVHDLESPSDEKESHMSLAAEDPMENQLEKEYRRIFLSRSKSKHSTSEKSKHPSTTSTLKRRFEALRRGLGKKDDSAKNAVIVSKISSHVSVATHKDVSINSDPPSLEGRSFSQTKIYNPFPTGYSRDQTIYNPTTSHYRRNENEKKERDSAQWSSRPGDDDSECQGVKGMFKLWGKKFNLEEEQYKRRCTPKPSYNSSKINSKKKIEEAPLQIKPELEEKKEGKRFFFFKKKNKEKAFKSKKGVTAGRCEVRDRLMIKIGGAPNAYVPKFRETEPEVMPMDYEEMIKQVWIDKFLSHSIDSRNSVHVRWNNKTYATSSSTIFELMDNVYKDTGVIFRSKSQITSQSSYRSYHKQRVNFVQNIQAWMIPNTTIDRSSLIPAKLRCKSNEERKDNIEVSISDQKWFIDKSKAFSHKIEVVLHSKNFKKVDTKESSEYLRIDIPQGFFRDSSSDDNNKPPTNQSSEEVYKIVEYETGSDLRKDKTSRIFDIGDHKQNNIKVTVSVVASKDCVSKNTESPPLSRDVVLQGSNVHIPNRCDVIGVGVITQRDLRQSQKPILKIQDDYSDDESSDHNILKANPKKCEFAESYLQEYYKNWTPLDNELYSWRVSDPCGFYNQTTIVAKSQPNIKDQRIKENQPPPGAGQKHGWFGSKKSKPEDDKCCESEKWKVLPKDSIEVFKRRKIYAASMKSKWACPDMLSSEADQECCPEEPPSTQQAKDTQNSTRTECPKLKKSCLQSMERKPRSRMCKKHVALPDCDTINAQLIKNNAKIPSDSELEGILAFKGSSGCDACKKDPGFCPKHPKINPEPTEIPPPPCKESCETKKKPPCVKYKISCDNPPEGLKSQSQTVEDPCAPTKTASPPAVSPCTPPSKKSPCPTPPRSKPSSPKTSNKCLCSSPPPNKQSPCPPPKPPCPPPPCNKSQTPSSTECHCKNNKTRTPSPKKSSQCPPCEQKKSPQTPPPCKPKISPQQSLQSQPSCPPNAPCRNKSPIPPSPPQCKKSSSSSKKNICTSCGLPCGHGSTCPKCSGANSQPSTPPKCPKPDSQPSVPPKCPKPDSQPSMPPKCSKPDSQASTPPKCPKCSKPDCPLSTTPKCPKCSKTDSQPSTPPKCPKCSKTDSQASTPPKCPKCSKSDSQPSTPAKCPKCSKPDCPLSTSPKCPICSKTDSQPSSPSKCPKCSKTDSQDSTPPKCPKCSKTDSQPSTPPKCPKCSKPDCPLSTTRKCPKCSKTESQPSSPSKCPKCSKTDSQASTPPKCPKCSKTDSQASTPPKCPKCSKPDCPLSTTPKCPKCSKTDNQPSTPPKCPICSKAGSQPSTPPKCPICSDTGSPSSIPAKSSKCPKDRSRSFTPPKCPICSKAGSQPSTPPKFPICSDTGSPSTIPAKSSKCPKDRSRSFTPPKCPICSKAGSQPSTPPKCPICSDTGSPTSTPAKSPKCPKCSKDRNQSSTRPKCPICSKAGSQLSTPPKGLECPICSKAGSRSASPSGILKCPICSEARNRSSTPPNGLECPICSKAGSRSATPSGILKCPICSEAGNRASAPPNGLQCPICSKAGSQSATPSGITKCPICSKAGSQSTTPTGLQCPICSKAGSRSATPSGILKCPICSDAGNRASTPPNGLQCPICSKAGSRTATPFGITKCPICSKAGSQSTIPTGLQCPICSKAGSRSAMPSGILKCPMCSEAGDQSSTPSKCPECPICSKAGSQLSTPPKSSMPGNQFSAPGKCPECPICSKAASRSSTPPGSQPSTPPKSPKPGIQFSTPGKCPECPICSKAASRSASPPRSPVYSEAGSRSSTPPGSQPSTPPKSPKPGIQFSTPGKCPECPICSKAASRSASPLRSPKRPIYSEVGSRSPTPPKCMPGSQPSTPPKSSNPGSQFSTPGKCPECPICSKAASRSASPPRSPNSPIYSEAGTRSSTPPKSPKCSKTKRPKSPRRSPKSKSGTPNSFRRNGSESYPACNLSGRLAPGTPNKKSRLPVSCPDIGGSSSQPRFPCPPSCPYTPPCLNSPLALCLQGRPPCPHTPPCPPIPPCFYSQKQCKKAPASCPTSRSTCCSVNNCPPFPLPLTCTPPCSPPCKPTSKLPSFCTKFFKKSKKKQCPGSPPGNPTPCQQSFCKSLGCQPSPCSAMPRLPSPCEGAFSTTSVSYGVTHTSSHKTPEAPFVYSPIHPCPVEPEKTKKTELCKTSPCSEHRSNRKLDSEESKTKKTDLCETSPCSEHRSNRKFDSKESVHQYPSPTQNQVSNQSSITSLAEMDSKPSYGKCRKDCSMMPKQVHSPKQECKASCPNKRGSPIRTPPMQCPPPKQPSPPSSSAPPSPGAQSPDPNSRNKSKMSGLYLKMMPAPPKPPPKPPTCSKDCSAWDAYQDDGTISLNSQEKITIRLKKETPSTTEIREGLNIKVQDEDGMTLFERCDYRQPETNNGHQHHQCCDMHPTSLLGDVYTSEVHRLTTNDSVQVQEINSDRHKEYNKAKSEASLANLIEIQFKLKVTQGDKTTEIHVANDPDTEKKSKEEIEQKDVISKVPQEVFIMKEEGKQAVEPLDQNNDINIRIVIKNFKSKSGKKKSVNLKQDYGKEFAKKISAKFHTVSTGYSGISQNGTDGNVFSIHRATVDLASSVDNKTRSNRSEEVISEPLTNLTEISKGLVDSSEPSKCKFITTGMSEAKSQDTGLKPFPSPHYDICTTKDIQEIQEDTDTEKLRLTDHEYTEETDHKYEYNEDTDTEKPIRYDTEDTDTDKQVEPPKYDTDETDIEKPTEQKSDPFLTTDTEPEMLPEIKKSKSIEVLVKPQTKEEKKEMLKQVFEKAHETNGKNRTKMRKLRDMLKVILTSDSSDHEDPKPTAELAKDVTYASLKPNFFRGSDSMNNYYRVESNPVLSKGEISKQVKYPTKENSSKSDSSNSNQSDVLSSEYDSSQANHGGCMCSTVAARLKLAARIEGGGCCCTQKLIKKSEETNCDIKTESEYLFGYQTTEFVDVETQKSRHLSSKNNSTNLSLHQSFKPSLVCSFNQSNNQQPEEIESMYSKDSSQPIYPHMNLLREYDLGKPKKNTILCKSQEEKIVLRSSGHPMKFPPDSGKERTKKAKEREAVLDPSDILQSYEAKKAVLEIYTEKTISDGGERLVAKLPKFVYDREHEIQMNYEAMVNNTYKSVCKRSIVMMAINR